MNKNTPIEDFLNSITAVTLPMLSLIIAFAMKITYLFYTVFEIPVAGLRLAASIFMALAVSLTMLTVSVNIKLFKSNYFQMLFAVGLFVVLLFVFGVISTEVLHWSEYVKRGFLASFLAAMEYMYSKLFTAKYERHKQQIEERKKLLIQAKTPSPELLELRRKNKELNTYAKALVCKTCNKQHNTVSQFRNCKHEPPS